MTIYTAKMRAETLALIDGTTPGPWVFSDKDTPGHFWITPEQGYLPPPLYLNVSGPINGENARLIAAAPTLAADTLRLLEEIERLTAENERLRAALRELVAACEARPVNISRADAALDDAHAVLRSLAEGDDA